MTAGGVRAEADRTASGSAWASVTSSAPAKLTLSLRVTGVRDDGFHLLDAEMVTVDLVDSLTFAPGDGVSIVDEVVGGLPPGAIGPGPDNLVTRALALVGRRASVEVVKRIPVGAGLGGGSADAAAVLRWARVLDPGVAVRLGADVAFCLRGGRARVTGIGETVEALPFEERRFVLLLPPFSVSTHEVYRAWDARRGPGGAGPGGDESASNELEDAAVAVAPRLAAWRDHFGDVCGRRPRLAGSGSTWFVEGEPERLGLDDREYLTLDGERAAVRAVATVPPSTAG
ncbi:MAG TPA: 4-(cytidine 5'-diphospho)-2-C-methyl-D-erythritol kinase [Acidimicrobiales bacterium]|nr:4-(cytidine 5'-diphospho)-2-C-methyl-D-erythritol kinase [Acidimicrobiales bacterium]